jgi:chromosome segregation ATPase
LTGGSWFGGGQAAKDLERCKVALKTARQELRRKIGENEQLHKDAYELQRRHESAIQLLKDKIHGINVELSEEMEKLETQEKTHADQLREMQAALEDMGAARRREEGGRKKAEAESREKEKEKRQLKAEQIELEERLEKVKVEQLTFDDAHTAAYSRHNVVVGLTGTLEEDDGTAAVQEAAQVAVKYFFIF